MTTPDDRHRLSDEGHALRSLAAAGNHSMKPWGFVPCAREHEAGRLCILIDGHLADRAQADPALVGETREQTEVLPEGERDLLLHTMIRSDWDDTRKMDELEAILIARERRIKAEALRKAADDMCTVGEGCSTNRHMLHRPAPALRERADRIAAKP